MCLPIGCQRVEQSAFFIAAAVIAGAAGAPRLAIAQSVTLVAEPLLRGQQTPAADLLLLVECAIAFCYDIG
jgi:hypothetical protein